jgi:tryptophanyl-tRNA synthetase
MRPTGSLHLGHYHGVLKNWIRLQAEYPCLFFVADWHALTTDYADTRGIVGQVRELALDWLAVGIDPERSHLFVQSDVKEHAELHLLLSMIVPLPWLERVPTYKEQQQELRDRELNTYGFLGYPLLQTADILTYRAPWVPVGEDQVPHLELSREIARRFNQLYGEVFPEPAPLLTRSARLPGTDGRKMSKSYGNAIHLSDPPAAVGAKIDSMLTDPQRTHRHIPGNPLVCPVFTHHGVFSTAATSAWADAGCRTAAIGCRDCKAALKASIDEQLLPIRERRRELDSDSGRVDRVLLAGAAAARETARATLGVVRRAMRIER